MRRTCTVAVALACFALVAASSSGGADDREFNALVKRVSKLEKGSADLKKAVASLEKALSNVGKDATTANKELNAVVARSDARTHLRWAEALLAEWFDEYHRRDGHSRYHRDQVSRHTCGGPK